MNNNSHKPPSPDSPRESMPSAASVAGKVYDRLARAGGLAVSAIFLVPVIAILLYAIVLDSREKKLLEANKMLDASIAAFEEGKIDESLGIIKDAGKQFPNLKIVKYYEGAILFGLEEDVESLERIEDFLSGSSDEILVPEALFMAGVSSFRLKKWEKAIGYFERILSMGDTFHEERVLPLLGTAYMENGNEAKAEATYTRFINAFPKSDRSHIPAPEGKKDPLGSGNATY